MKKALVLLMVLAMGAVGMGSSVFAGEAPVPEEERFEDVFAEWNEEAPALNALIDYVEAVTDETSPDYIPPVDRIAVFDMDGTLMGELYPTYLEYYMLAWRILKDPRIEPDAEMLEVGRTLRDCALDNSFPSDMPMQHAIQAARAYAGLTLNEFADFVTEILVRDVDGFEGMTYGECFYLPMVEVVEYLQDNDFKVYVCSGSDRFICRTFIEGMLDIPYENIIGMDVQLEATGQGDTEGLDYVFTLEDDVIRTDKLLIKNLKTNKVLQIAQEIGRQPVLSFGNSSGDVSMHNYTISNNVYRSAAFMLIADDDVRDYGNPEKAEGLREKWESAGYNVISMRDDFRTIYGHDVVKTGTFHWMEELAEDVPAEEVSLGTLLVDLVKAYENPAPDDLQRIDADAEALQNEVAATAAEQWKKVYLDPEYRLLLDGTDDPMQLEIPDDSAHAFVVLGYELENGQMTDELKGRCNAAASAAKAFPNSILVCTGGATGKNNPENHTEAGLMKDYLANECGIDPERVFTDERAMTTAENALNTYVILKEQDIQTMTIITSSYHQRWGQVLYCAVGEQYNQESGYSAEIIGNYCYDVEPSVPMYEMDDRIAAWQLAMILGMPEEEIRRLAENELAFR